MTRNVAGIILCLLLALIFFLAAVGVPASRYDQLTKAQRGPSAEIFLENGMTVTVTSPLPFDLDAASGSPFSLEINGKIISSTKNSKIPAGVDQRDYPQYHQISVSLDTFPFANTIKFATGKWADLRLGGSPYLVAKPATEKDFWGWLQDFNQIEFQGLIIPLIPFYVVAYLLCVLLILFGSKSN